MAAATKARKTPKKMAHVDSPVEAPVGGGFKDLPTPRIDLEPKAIERFFCRENGCGMEITPEAHKESGLCVLHNEAFQTARKYMGEAEMSGMGPVAPKTATRMPAGPPAPKPTSMQAETLARMTARWGTPEWADPKKALSLVGAGPIDDEDAATVLVGFLNRLARREATRLTEIGRGYTKMFPWVPMAEVVYEALDRAAERMHDPLDDDDHEPYISAWLGPRQHPLASWAGRYRLLADLTRAILGQFMNRTEAEAENANAMVGLIVEAAIRREAAGREAMQRRVAALEAANAAAAKADTDDETDDDSDDDSDEE